MTWLEMKDKLDKILSDKGIAESQAFSINDAPNTIYYRDFVSTHDGAWSIEGMADVFRRVEKYGITARHIYLESSENYLKSTGEL